MKIVGNSFQEREPTPDNPVEIKHEQYLVAYVDGKETRIPCTKEFEKIKDRLFGIELRDGDYVAILKPNLEAEVDELGS